MNYKHLAEQFWNKIADEYNQWEELDKDEKIVLEYFVQSKIQKVNVGWEDLMSREINLWLLKQNSD